LELEPGNVEATVQLASVHQFKREDWLLPRLHSLLENPEISPEEKRRIHGALGKAYSDLKDYESSFNSYKEMNSLTDDDEPFDRERFRQRIDETIRQFQKPNEQFLDDGAGIVPVFIVGLSRSGKSLVESLLASHPSVYPAGECHLWHQTIEKIAEKHGGHGEFPENISAFGEREFRELGSEYLGQIAGRASKARYYVNTLPGYFAYVGLIMKCLPTAKTIHCTRNLLDNALFIYFKQYGHGHEYSCDLKDLAAYMHGYGRLMLHWSTLFGEHILQIKYEALVRDYGTESEKIFQHCGLELLTTSPEPDFHQGEIGQWKNYEPCLGELIDQLA
jgi:hypothetical protein